MGEEGSGKSCCWKRTVFRDKSKKVIVLDLLLRKMRSSWVVDIKASGMERVSIAPMSSLCLSSWQI